MCPTNNKVFLSVLQEKYCPCNHSISYNVTGRKFGSQKFYMYINHKQMYLTLVQNIKVVKLKKENNLAQRCLSERVLHRHRVLSLNGIINLSPQRESPVKLGNGTVCASLMSLMSCSIQLSAVTHRRCKPAVMQNFAPQSPVYKLSYCGYFETSE